MCDLCNFDRQYPDQIAHSNACPHCVARFISWVEKNRPDKKEIIESVLSYAEKQGITRDQVREIYRSKQWHAPITNGSGSDSASEKPTRAKRH